MDIPPLLLDHIRKRKVIVCAGPDLAVSAGLPGYQELANAFWQKAGASGQSPNFENAVSAYLDKTDIPQVISFLETLLINDMNHMPVDISIYQGILDIPFLHTILYSYWDNLFDKVPSRNKYINKIYDDQTLNYAGSDSLKIIKVCGDFENHQSIRLSEIDFKALPTKQPQFYKYLDYTLSNSHVLFLGYGLEEYKYPLANLLEFWRVIQAAKREEEKQHSKIGFLVSDSIQDYQIQILRKHNIHVIPGQTHEFLQTLSLLLRSGSLAKSKKQNDLLEALESMSLAQFDILCQDILQAEGYSIGDDFSGFERMSSKTIYDKEKLRKTLLASPTLDEEFFNFDLNALPTDNLHIITATMREGYALLDRLREMRENRTVDYWDGFYIAQKLGEYPKIAKKYKLDTAKPPQTLKTFQRYTNIQFQNLPDANPLIFYRGAHPTFSDINSALDASRIVESNGDKKAYVELLRNVKQHVEQHANHPSLILIKGVAGNGKSTLLKRLAYNLFRTESLTNTSMFELLDQKPRAGELTSEYTLTKKNMVLFADISETKKQVSYLHELSTELWDAGTPVIMIVAARENEWESANGNQNISADPKLEYSLSYTLNRDEATHLCLLLSKHEIFHEPFKFLNIDKQVERILSAPNTSGQLLPALYWATQGRRFEEILLTEYKDLLADDKQVALAYKYVFFVHGLGLSLPTGPICRLLKMSALEFYMQVRTTAKGLIVSSDLSTFIETRHRSVAEILTVNTPEFYDKSYLCGFIGDLIEKVEITENEERYLVLKLLLGLLFPPKNIKQKVKNAESIWNSVVIEITTKFRSLILEMVEYAEKMDRSIELTEWGRLFQLLGDMKKNLECLISARKVSETPDEYSLISYLIGKTFVEFGKNDLAGRYLEEAYKSKLRSQEFLNYFARFQIKLENYERAAVLMEESLIRNPDNRFTQLTYKKLLSRLRYERQQPRALAVCKAALEENPKNAWTVWNLARILIDLGRYDEAKGQLVRVIMLHEKKKDILWARAHNDLALLFTRLAPRDDQRAEELWKRSINNCPEFIASYLSYGRFLTDMHRYDEATLHFRKALSVDSGRKVSILQELGEYLRLLKEKKQNSYKELIRRDHDLESVVNVLKKIERAHKALWFRNF